MFKEILPKRARERRRKAPFTAPFRSGCVHARTPEHLFPEIIPLNSAELVIGVLCTGCMQLHWAAAGQLMQFQFFSFQQLLDALWMIPKKMGKKEEGRANKGVGKSRKETKIGSFFSYFYYFWAIQRIKLARLETFSTGAVFSHLKYNF